MDHRPPIPFFTLASFRFETKRLPWVNPTDIIGSLLITEIRFHVKEIIFCLQFRQIIPNVHNTLHSSSYSTLEDTRPGEEQRMFSEAIKAGLRVARICNSAFLEYTFNPALGFDLANSTVNVVGSADTRFSVTSQPDIGFSVAGVIALWTENPSAVPLTVFVASDTATFSEVRDLLSKACGREFKLKTEDPVEVKKTLLAQLPKEGDNYFAKLYEYGRYLLDSGVADHSVNDNELINPGEKYWKWKKNADYIEEAKQA